MQRGKTRTLDGIRYVRLGLSVASAAVAAGGLVILATVTSAVKAIRALDEMLASPEPTFVYILLPTAWNGLMLYGIGVAADMMFRGPAARIGRSARIVWQTHLVFTTLLLFGLLVAGAVTNGDMRVGLAGNGFYALMLLAHGTALVCGGTLFLRAARQ